jgi:hypothetical protein
MDLTNSNSNLKKSAGTLRAAGRDSLFRVRVRVTTRLTALGPGRGGYGKAYPCMTLQCCEKADCPSYFLPYVAVRVVGVA